jgi:hypothetical protein
MLYGDRFATILHVNNPGIEISGFGQEYAKWNRNEHSYKDRNITAQEIKIYRYRED